MKIAFLIRHALYLRNFESTVRGLASRGHEISLVFSPFVRQVDGTLATILTGDYPNVKELPVAPRTGWWWPVSDAARVLRDYLRYLEPDYVDAPALRSRGARRLPPRLHWIFEHVPGMKSRPVRALLRGALRQVDRAIPPDPGIVAALTEWSPDLVVVTPMIDFSYGQTDYVKAARSLRIPTVLAVASWDNLTNKGLAQICPDRVLVWNAMQEEEAVRMHGIPRERVLKTGAQLYDQWFDMSASLDRDAFCAQAGGLDPVRPIILYLCSSAFICPDEVGFVRQWLTELRRSTDPLLCEANVIVRPHPQHSEQWRGESLAGYGKVVIWPPERGAPLDDSRKKIYFDSIYHAAVVVGINTSGFIEAGIIGRRTLTLATPHFKESQEGTLHFRYLTGGGLLEVARSFEDHLAQLARVLGNQVQTQQRVRTFIADFVRPAGLDRPAAPLVIEAIEQAAHIKAQHWPTPFYASLIRAVLRPWVAPVRREVLGRVSYGMYQGVERTRFPHYLPPVKGAPHRSLKELQEQSQLTYRALEWIAESDRPVIVGPWLDGVDQELLYWLPMLRWAQECYGLDPNRLVAVSRGGVDRWYSPLAYRYVDFFDLRKPADFTRVAVDGRAPPQKGPIAETEMEILRDVRSRLDLGDYDVLHPKLMAGLFHLYWSGRSSLEHLRHHARYLPLTHPEPGEIETRLPENYYAVCFPSRPWFGDTNEHRQFVRDLVERLLERSDVVLLEPSVACGGAETIGWEDTVSNRRFPTNRLTRAGDWMAARSSLDVQSRIIAKSRCFIGTYGGPSHMALFLRKPCIAFHLQYGDVENSMDSTALAVSAAFNVPFIVLRPEDSKLLNESL